MYSYIIYVNIASIKDKELSEKYGKIIGDELKKIGLEKVAIIPVYEGDTRLERISIE